MGKIALGEARTTSSDERVMIRSRVWPDRRVGPETCCKRLNVSSQSINFLMRSSKWRLKSPEIRRTSGHITFSKIWENSWKKTEAETGCNEEYTGIQNALGNFVHFFIYFLQKVVKESNLCLVVKFAFVTLYKTSSTEWDDGISPDIYGAATSSKARKSVQTRLLFMFNVRAVCFLLCSIDHR